MYPEVREIKQRIKGLKEELKINEQSVFQKEVLLD